MEITKEEIIKYLESQHLNGKNKNGELYLDELDLDEIIRYVNSKLNKPIKINMTKSETFLLIIIAKIGIGILIVWIILKIFNLI